MTDAAALSLQPVGLWVAELHGFLVELQERRQAAAADALPMAEKARRLADKARVLAQQWAQARPQVAQRLQHISQRLAALDLSRERGTLVRTGMAWKIAKHYEGIARMLRAEPTVAVPLPELRPKNYARNAFHIGNGFFSAGLYTAIDDRATMLWIALGYCAWMLGLEVARRLNPRLNRYLVDKVFGAIARPSEAWRMNSASWYGIAIVVMLASGAPRLACIAAVLTLGLGDPAAALIGRRWGQRKLYGRKSLAGSLGFFGVACAAVITWFAVFAPTLLPDLGFAAWAAQAVPIAVVAGFAGAIAELFSDRLEDNLTITLAVAGCCAFVA
ncbi:MAG: hypothetical protein FJ100_05655 [Deltaproteobacteria bacterium]|nr:hypothetical protein [Deltaproteobacteria bacterium]